MDQSDQELLLFLIAFRQHEQAFPYLATAATIQQIVTDFTSEGRFGGVYPVFVPSDRSPRTLALRLADVLYIG